MELPVCTELKMDMWVLTLASPTTLKPLPIREVERKDRQLPQDTKRRSDIEDPHRTKERIDTDEPML
jgi:hypothetical protein